MRNVPKRVTRIINYAVTIKEGGNYCEVNSTDLQVAKYQESEQRGLKLRRGFFIFYKGKSLQENAYIAPHGIAKSAE